MKWRLIDSAISAAAVVLLYLFGGWPAACIGAVWAMWNYADGRLNISRRGAA